jgi:hypothetical protein
MRGVRSVREALRPGLVAAAIGVGLLVGYTAAVDPVVRSPPQVAYPLVWLLASGAALKRYVVPALASASLPALAVGSGYALALQYTAGLLGPASAPSSTSVHLALPGWGPALVHTGPLVSVSVIPFLTVGYLTLGALAAVAVDRTWSASGPGLLGLFACVSCTAPLIGAVAGSLGAGTVAATVSHAQYPLATGAFLLSVGGFAWLLPVAES